MFIELLNFLMQIAKSYVKAKYIYIYLISEKYYFITEIYFQSKFIL